MKIKVAYLIELDDEAWSRYRGLDTTDVREDVKSYVLNALQWLPKLEEADAKVLQR